MMVGLIMEGSEVDRREIKMTLLSISVLQDRSR